ncbi:SMP-30/gluconolactonase/LRE family protein [Flammeovirga yaeyamensis]|uniref:SMP-30/gluconolactonase/LRE family protein n=1 Tax=Flammeovirga yaeyamensis TaxID=367791 RepID=A0AAX1NAB7_9BACT|nr:SMP-30/gluconolactonase/LRE family protein [Flammeovirga yaeyamensis]MBB3699165.1 sugar lactone lactonase YvrE [Flammeovirga yaeyamensis]NMF35571.1 SMP-30/gluconolactonase/LRE family protein [Flammeovirga yaeyamensis]QWG04429.1 SMP-30/gluconolactonase/LRE family protein [Flammeovirga yaeyamensis]
MMTKKVTFSFLIAVLLFIGNFVFQACSIQPLAWTPPQKPELKGSLKENDLLASTEWIDLNGWYGPEDIAVDQDGNLYCGAHVSATDFTDGRILKIDTLGEVSEFCNPHNWVTGLDFDAEENLIACIPNIGLGSIDKNGKLTVLTEKDENDNPFLMLNDVDIAQDGNIYFSNTSSKVKFSRKHARKIIFEVKPDGGLYRYNPSTKVTQTLIDGAYFANGVAVSQNDDFVLLVELTKYRIIRYWLKGDKKGTIDIFIDNLPGLPNGIAKRSDGSFWVGFTTRRDDTLDKFQPKPFMKKLIYATPLWLQPKQESFGMIMHLSEEGKVIKTYYEPTGEIVSEASSVEEHNGYLYLGGDLTDHIGRYKLVE